MSLARLLKRHPITGFFVITFVVSWSLGILLYLSLRASGKPPSVTQADPFSLLILFLAGGMASLTGIGMTFVVDGKEGIKELFLRLKRWNVGIYWYGTSVLTTFVSAGVVLLILWATISGDFYPAILREQNPATLIVFGLIFGISIGLLEEFGWTGFALPRMLKRYPAFSAALRLGILWSLWHALLTLWIWPVVPSTNLGIQIIGGLVWMAALVPYRILMCWVTINAGMSLFIGILMHAFYDGILILLVPAALPSIQVLIFYSGLTIVLGIFSFAVWASFGAKTLMGKRESDPSLLIQEEV